MQDEYYDNLLAGYDSSDYTSRDNTVPQNRNGSSPLAFDDFYYFEDDGNDSSSHSLTQCAGINNTFYTSDEHTYGGPAMGIGYWKNDNPLNDTQNALNTSRGRSYNTNTAVQPSSSQYQNTSRGNARSQIWSQERSGTYNLQQQLHVENFVQPEGRETQSRPNPRNSHQTRLRPVSDLPDMYRTIFKFGVFNAVQSTCFDEVMTSNKNLVISAPTGSGKTVLFELGLIRMVEQHKNIETSAKCVYVAPTKALCSERFQDWAAKFEPIGLKCCELTGDTVTFGNNAWGDAKNATIIVTTCEKWDSLTRNWYDHERILSQIHLFLVDEVHILNESRGSTLEVVISRMKLRGTSILRFILVSATVPNIQDVAQWIECGTGSSAPAQVFEFGEEYRPCRLVRHVVGVSRRNGCNDFQFAKVLDGILYSTLAQFSVGKPILVFCATRKGVFGTADQLMKDFLKSESSKSALPWSRPSKINHSFSDKRLDDLACAGIGVHHAGLVMEDRKATERLYSNKILRVLIATSTLAVGVNLPAQLVVIKGVHMFQNNAMKEYSDLDVMQMLGRAGRPQFDKEGIAVIICEQNLEAKYTALAQGNTILESSLHVNLAEHLNSEIGLKTINDVETAKTWLRSSFLYQRMKSNRKYYSLEADIDNVQRTYQENVDEIIVNSITQLTKSQLVERKQSESDKGKLVSTHYGEIMSKLYIRRATMDLILAIPKHATLREILESICGAEEFQDVKLRASEKSAFNALRKNPDIRFEVKKVETTTHKVFSLVQAVLAGINLNEYKTPESQPQLEAFSVFRHISRISRAFLDVVVVKKEGLAIKHALELFRCLSAKAWEDRAIVLRQIEQLGEKSIKVLAEHGITSLGTLRKQNPLRIEALLNRRPPFGMDVLASVADLPEYTLTITEVSVQSDGGKNPVQLDLLISCGLSVKKVDEHRKTKKQRGRTFRTTAVLTLTSDNDLIDLRRIPTKALADVKSFEVTADLKKPSQSIIVIITSESIAGVVFQQIYKPTVAASEYPVLDTRPMSSVEMDLVGLEDDPDFWNMTLDSSSAIGVNQLDTKETQEIKLETVRPKSRPAHNSDQTPKSINMNATLGETAESQQECNHPCKDKTKCRHLCCREGITVRPISRSKSNNVQVQEPVTQHTAISTVQRIHTLPAPNVSVVVRKEAKNIKSLDAIHERTQVAQNLRLAENKRLKLESPRPSKRKRREPIEYDISFTQLADDQPDDYLDISDQSDSDSFPEVIIPIATHFHSKTKQASSENKQVQENHPRKRIKRKNTEQIHTTLKKATRKLFLEGSDSDNSIKIVAAGSKSTEKSDQAQDTDSSTRAAAEQDFEDSPEFQSLCFLPKTIVDDSTLQQKVVSPTVEHEHNRNTTEEKDEFADLDAWLQSDSVEIL